MGVCMRNNRRNEQSSATTALKQPRNDDPEGLDAFGKGLLDLLDLVKVILPLLARVDGRADRGGTFTWP